MPGNLIPAAPTTVMPAHLSKAFQEQIRMEIDLNMYPDGSSDRNPLALNVRHYFTMTQPLSPADWQAMRTFFYQHQGQPFYFYNLRETEPPFSWDPSGQATVGRYTVVFDGVFSDTYSYQRGSWASVSISLREIV